MINRMFDSIGNLLEQWQMSGYIYGMFLVFCRVSAVVSLLPGFGEQFLSARVKVFIALALAFIIYPSVDMPHIDSVAKGALLYQQIFIETVKGIMLGLWIRLLFLSLTIAAGFCSQILGITNIFDASLEPGGAPALSGFFSFTTIALIMASGAHYMFIQSMIESYVALPFLSPLNVSLITKSIVEAGSTSFMLGLRVALPFLGIGFLVNIGLGFINRAMPQIPVFFVGQPLMIAVGFFLLSILIPSMMFNWAETISSFIAERF